MNTTTEEDKENTIIEPQQTTELSWGPWLFRAVFVVSLIFAWWLVIYDHGVASVHG